ncbi:hypothetical protein LCGC14_0365250 [marine sediment metagenome]|uniref:Uncharacterized protein n=1 Tax=marine sediment metagenome TaxID=412755 RepID=A0A0F9TCJ3_9ZZZZ
MKEITFFSAPTNCRGCKGCAGLTKTETRKRITYECKKEANND